MAALVVSAPLEGLLVADFGRVLAAPYATMMLADLGAEVVKVERPGGGDDTRAWGPPWVGGESTYFLSVNRGKRSLVADLAEHGDRALVDALVARADVLVENFRPGTLERHGLGWDAVHALNPALVYCSVTGFGAGAGADLPGYDLLVQAVGGLMSLTGDGDRPTKAGVALVDVLTGVHLVVGVLAALRAREATGQGQRVQVDLLSTLLSSLVNQGAAFTVAGVVPRAMGNRHPSIAPYEVLPSADRPLVVAVGTDRQFAALCRGLGLPDLALDPRFATNPDRVAHVEELVALLSERLRTRPADQWSALLTPLGVPCGPVNDLPAAFALAEGLGLGGRVAVGGGADAVDLVANPIVLSGAPTRYDRRPPRLGEHTEQLRAQLLGEPTPGPAAPPPRPTGDNPSGPSDGSTP